MLASAGMCGQVARFRRVGFHASAYDSPGSGCSSESGCSSGDACLCSDFPLMDAQTKRNRMAGLDALEDRSEHAEARVGQQHGTLGNTPADGGNIAVSDVLFVPYIARFPARAQATVQFMRHQHVDRRPDTSPCWISAPGGKRLLQIIG